MKWTQVILAITGQKKGLNKLNNLFIHGIIILL